MNCETPPNSVHVRVLISGRVQGVSFRASTANQAKRLRISGIARNLADGRVEVVASGTPDAIEELMAWLQHGPRFARVDTVQVDELAAECGQAGGFTTA